LEKKKSLRIAYIISNIIAYLLSIYAFLSPFIVDDFFIELAAGATFMGFLILLIAIYGTYQIRKWIAEGKL
jgi:hypothetical protein